jgi:hypothetical protein
VREQDQVLKGVRPPGSSIFQVTFLVVLKMEEIPEIISKEKYSQGWMTAWLLWRHEGKERIQQSLWDQMCWSKT